MPGRDKPLITRNGIPDPQAYNPQTGQWESFIGVSWGKTAGGLYVPIRVDDQGRQEVTLSGTIVILHNGLENNPIVIPSLSRVSVSFEVPMGMRKWHLFFGRHDWSATANVSTIDFDGYRLTSSALYPFTPNISGVEVLEKMGGRFVRDRTSPKGSEYPMGTWAIMDAPVLFPGESHTVFFYNTDQSSERQIRPVILGEY